MIKHFYLLPVNNNEGKEHIFRVEVRLFDSIIEMTNDNTRLNGKYKLDKMVPTKAASFSTKDKSKDAIGIIRFSKDRMKVANILHEAYHATLEAFRLIDKCDMKYEEMIVSASALFGQFLIKEYASFIIE